VNVHPAALQCACQAFGVARILLGTDFPYLLGPHLQRVLDSPAAAGLSAADQAAIDGGNAAALLGIRAHG
jgi:hypothetical protein